MPALFDMELRALRRDRAARLGPELFVHERAFDDCLDRLSLMQRRFESALLIGCPDSEWPDRLKVYANDVAVRDPGPMFANGADGALITEDGWQEALNKANADRAYKVKRSKANVSREQEELLERTMKKRLPTGG